MGRALGDIDGCTEPTQRRIRHVVVVVLASLVVAAAFFAGADAAGRPTPTPVARDDKAVSGLRCLRG